MIELGTVRPGSTIRIPFSSFDKDDGSSITMTNYAAADILIYKDGNTTERASTAGFTATTDFDGKTGKHLAIIDLSDNTTSGFYNAGSEYLVAIDAVTVDLVTTGAWIARFRIGYPDSWFDTTIATLSTQTSFTLTAGPAEDDAINGCTVIIHDIASAVQCGWAVVLDYTGSTKTVTLAAGTTFAASAGDNISIMRPHPLQPATSGRTVVVDSAGLVDANTVKVGPTGSGTAQTAGDIMADTNDIQTRLPAALVGGRMDSSIGAMAANVLTASAIAADAITAAKIADGAIDAATFAAGAIDNAAIATDAIGSAELAASAVTEIQAGLSTLDAAGVRAAVGLASANLDTQLGNIAGFIDTEVAAIKAKTDNLPASPAATGDAMTLTSAYDFAKGTVAATEAYAADGAAATPIQMLYMILQSIMEIAISGTTMTIKKLDGSTTAMTVTLNDATNPTSRTRSG